MISAKFGLRFAAIFTSKTSFRRHYKKIPKGKTLNIGRNTIYRVYNKVSVLRLFVVPKHLK